MATSNVIPGKNQTTKVSKDTFKMIIENKNIDLLAEAKNNTIEIQKPKNVSDIWKNEILEQAKKEAKKEEQVKKRALNPTISKLVGEQKRENLSEFKSDAKKILIATKGLLKQIKEKDLSIYENEELIKKANSLVNYITSPKNAEVLNLFLTFARPTKNGFYTESNFSFLIQQITKISIDKNKDFSESINYFEALRKAKK